MVRLILLLAPIASALGGVFIGRLFAWCVEQILPCIIGEEKTSKTTKVAEEKQNKQSSKKKKREVADATAYEPSSFEGLVAMKDAFALMSNSSGGKVCKRIVAVISLLFMLIGARFFRDYAWGMAAVLSNPSIITKARTQSGEVVVVDDYREAYFWLRDHTPKDARVLSWWDYGYQITGISNRTTLADGNTWNHEHIALLGRILTGPEAEGHEIARHLSDYALVWAGGGGDDLAKSPHLARIANSVFRKHCPGDPTCRSFGFMDKYGTPSPKMAKSFLYKLHSHRLKPGVEADPKKFREVYRTKYGKVRIYKILAVSKESKSWVASKKNRKCDVPGSWFCPGQYPPALEPYLKEKKDFGQLEDFNRKTVDQDYQKAYMENLADPKKATAAGRKALQDDMRKEKKQQTKQQRQKVQQEEEEEDEDEDDSDDMDVAPKVSEAQLINLFHKWKSSDEVERQIEESYSTYQDSEESTLMWKVVTSNAKNDLIQWLAQYPIAAYVRSSDGRGPMWWAYEANNMAIVDLFKKLGLSERDKDSHGKRPIDLLVKKQNQKKR